MRWLFYLALLLPASAQNVTVFILNNTTQANAYFIGTLTLATIGAPTSRGTGLGIPVLKGEYEWQLTPTIGILQAEFRLDSNLRSQIASGWDFQRMSDSVRNAQPIRCSIPAPTGRMSYFLHFTSPTTCTIT